MLADHTERRRPLSTTAKRKRQRGPVDSDDDHQLTKGKRIRTNWPGVSGKFRATVSEVDDHIVCLRYDGDGRHYKLSTRKLMWETDESEPEEDELVHSDDEQFGDWSFGCACGRRNRSEDWSSKWIECDECDAWSHAACTEIADEYAQLTSAGMGTYPEIDGTRTGRAPTPFEVRCREQAWAENASWLCQTCKRPPAMTPSLLSPLAPWPVLKSTLVSMTTPALGDTRPSAAWRRPIRQPSATTVPCTLHGAVTQDRTSAPSQASSSSQTARSIDPSLMLFAALNYTYGEDSDDEIYSSSSRGASVENNAQLKYQVKMVHVGRSRGGVYAVRAYRQHH